MGLGQDMHHKRKQANTSFSWVCQENVLFEKLEDVETHPDWSENQRQCYTWGVAMVRVVDAGVEGSAQRGLCLRRRGSPAPWPPLVAQLFLSSPLGSSIGKPHLRIRHQLSPMTSTMTYHKHINSWLNINVPAHGHVFNIYINTCIHTFISTNIKCI